MPASPSPPTPLSAAILMRPLCASRSSSSSSVPSVSELVSIEMLPLVARICNPRSNTPLEFSINVPLPSNSYRPETAVKAPPLSSISTFWSRSSPPPLMLLRPISMSPASDTYTSPPAYRSMRSLIVSNAFTESPKLPFSE